MTKQKQKKSMWTAGGVSFAILLAIFITLLIFAEKAMPAWAYFPMVFLILPLSGFLALLEIDRKIQEGSWWA